MPRTSLIWYLALVVIFVTKTVEPNVLLPPFLSNFINSDSIGFERPDGRIDVSEIELNYRLPNATYPEHYNIVLTTNVHTGERSFQGVVTIDVVVIKTTTEVVLHMRQLNITQVTMTIPLAKEKEELLSYQYELKREFLTLRRKGRKEFAADTKFKLIINYNGLLRSDNGGFYLSTYVDDEGKTHYLATTQFESTNARHAFPCYDEPDKRANFTITINHSPNYSAISNMPVNVELSSAGKTVFYTTDRMPTYIVAFIVFDFESSGGTFNNLPQKVYSHSSLKDVHEWALISGMIITERLSEYYGVKFMLPKVDHVAVPDFAAGGMENWGLVTYREEYLLYDKDISTVFTKTTIASIIAHELCHQWFGNYVAIKWWTYLWLKEGFATLFSYKALDDAYPDWGVWQEFHAGDYQHALIQDGRDSPRPMTHYVQKPNAIAGLYDFVSYSKAGSVLHMWNNALTDKVFQRGLHNYLTIHQYNAAVEEELFSAIQTAAKEENYAIPATISEMMGTWSRQGGYPLITVTRNYDDGTFTVMQNAYHDDETITDEKTWYVPINYASASNPDFRNTEATHYLLNITKMKISNVKLDKKDWLLLNKQSTYFYRIKYDVDNYNLITKCLIERPYKIHPRSRAQLMSDAFYLSVSKRLDHVILLQMLTYLKKENEFAPWAAANNIINTYNRYLSGDSKYDDFKFFIAELVVPIYEKLDLIDIPGEQHYQKYTRNIVINIACLAGVKDCLDETNARLKYYVTHNIPIEPNLQAPIYCNGLKQSGGEEFDFFYKKLMDSTDQALRRLLITSLGCTQNENHIKKFVYSSIEKTNTLRAQERYTLLNSVYSKSEVGLLACIEFLQENWSEYGDLSGGFGSSNPLDDDIRRMAKFVVNKNQQEKLLALVETVKNSKYVTPTLETSVNESISDNFEWISDNRDTLMSWFSQYRAEKSDTDKGKESTKGSGSSASSHAAIIILLSFALVSRIIHHIFAY